MKLVLAFLGTLMLVVSIWLYLAPAGTFQLRNQEGFGKFLKRIHSTAIRKREKIRKVTRKDLQNLMANLQHGTMVNEIVHPERLSPPMKKFLLKRKSLSYKALQIVKAKDSNRSGKAIPVKSPMVSRTIIYNRIYKSGSASFLCK